MSPCTAPKGTNTKVTSAKGHSCAYPSKDIAELHVNAEKDKRACNDHLSNCREAGGAAPKQAREQAHHDLLSRGSHNLVVWTCTLGNTHPKILRTGRLWILYDGLDQASEQFTRKYSQKAPKGRYAPRVHVRIHDEACRRLPASPAIVQQYNTIQYNTIPYHTIRYNIIQ